MAKKPETPITEEKVHVGLKCPKGMRDAIIKIAHEEDRSLSRQIVHVLRCWLRDRAKQ